MTGHDPQKIGEALVDLRSRYPGLPFSELADLIPWQKIPSCPSTSAGTLTVQSYKDELAQRKDKHAQHMLAALEVGEKIEDEPGGF